MKKVLLYNLDVGSGVEYSGNVIAKWVKELPVEFHEYKIQNPPCLSVNGIIETKPDIVIINDNCPRVLEGPYYYKKFFPDVKIIYCSHGIQELQPPLKNGNIYLLYDRMLLYIGGRDLFDKIVSFGYIKDENEIPPFLQNDRFLRGCFPVDLSEYYIKTPWAERTKMFCNIGQLNDLKFSLEFLTQLKEYNDLQVDCYGLITDNTEYKKALNIKQINYCGFAKQETIPDILNQYKYFVLPHGRIKEIFNISLLQAINCGTIPLVCNDRTADFDYTWIDWAKELYVPHNQEEQLLKTMTSPTLIEKDYSYLANDISKKAKFRFDYLKFKNEFQSVLKGWL